MIRANSWTAAEEAWLREQYPHHTNAVLSELHGARFPERPRRSDKAINSRGKVLGLRKASDYIAEGERRTVWTPEREAWLRSFAPGRSIYEIIDEFERVFGIRLSKYAMKNAKVRFGVRSGTNAGQFQKGGIPANKGKTWDELGFSEQARANMRKGQFKKGSVPSNGAAIPLGAERIGVDGYVQVKVANLSSAPCKNDCWRLKHNLVWEKANGMPVPPKHMVVFGDRDKGNFDPGNLVLVPRRIWAVIQRRRIAYHDAESLRAAMAIAELDHAVFHAQLTPRECRRCGSEFKPRYPQQRTCDTCLGNRR